MLTDEELRTLITKRLTVGRLGIDSASREDLNVLTTVLETLRARAVQDAKDEEYLMDLLSRRAHAFLATPNDRKAGEKAEAETTTQDDIGQINHMARSRGEVVAHLVAVHTDVWEDFRTGRRCAVCGMTSAQAAAANYDCRIEC